MTNAQINCFLAVIKYKSFSKAADHLYVSQSAISKNISQLEKSVGYILIDRANGSVRLTAVGELFYQFFLENEARLERLKKEVEILTSDQADDIRLGCLDGWDLSQFYPRIRNIFRDKYPSVRLNLEGYDHVAILHALSQKIIDVAITLAITLPANSKIISRTIATAPAIMMFSSNHRLADKPDLSLYDFRDEPVYIISPDNRAEINPMEQLALELCRKAGFEPKLSYVPNSASILLKLQSGEGVQITCQWTCASHFSLYKTRKLDKELEICAAWMDDGRTPSKHLFVNELLRIDIGE